MLHQSSAHHLGHGRGYSQQPRLQLRPSVTQSCLGLHRCSSLVLKPCSILPTRARTQPPTLGVCHAASSSSSRPAGGLPRPGQQVNNLAQLIADVLNAEKGAQAEAGPDNLLNMLDSLGAGVNSSITRTWEGRDAWLEVRGTWDQGAEARKFAMLAVYHERVWQRSLQLGTLFQLVLRHRPGVIPQAAADKVAAGIAAQPLGGACASLSLMELLLLGVACLDLQQLHAQIQGASDDTWQELKDQVWVTRVPLRATNLQLQLSSMCSSWSYQVQLCRIRLHHASGIAAVSRYLEKMKGKGAAGQGGQAGSRSLWVSNSGGDGKDKSTASGDEAIGTAEVNFIAGQLGAFVREGLTGPLCGRQGWVSFGRGGAPASSPDAAARRTSSGRPRGSLARDGGAVGGAGFGADVIHEFREVYIAGEESRAAHGKVKAFSQGAAISFEGHLRKRLINALCAWSDAHPDLVAVQPLQPHCTHSVRIGTLSPEHVNRGVRIRVEGVELSWLRDQARTRLGGFLEHWDPYLGNPFKGKQEWQYNEQAPVIWNRLCYFPPDADTTKLTLFWRHPSPASPQTNGVKPTPAAQQTAAAPTWDQADVTLSLSELRSFLTVLLDLVPAVLSVASSGYKSGSKSGNWLGPSSLQIRYLPVPVTAMTPSKSLHSPEAVAAATADGNSSFQPAPYEIRWLTESGTGNGGDSSRQYQSARLMTSHIQSLLGIYEDVSSRFPDLVPVPPSPSTLTLPHSSSHATSWPATVTKLLGAAALLACIPLGLSWRASRAAGEQWSPVLALQQLPTAAYQLVQQGRSSIPQQQQQQQQQQQPQATPASSSTAVRHTGTQPGNAVLDPELLASLCNTIVDLTDDKMWLPVWGGAQQRQGVEEGGQSGNVTAPEQARKLMKLMYQVVVSRDGQVLGCMPCDSVSARWYAHLPLSAAIRSQAAQRQQTQLMESSQPGGNPGRLPGTYPALAAHASFVPLPGVTPGSEGAPATADVAVLALRLQQDTQRVEKLGSGWNEQTVAVMRATVTPWTLSDSVAMWAVHNVDVPDSEPYASSAPDAIAGVGQVQKDAASQVIRLDLGAEAGQSDRGAWGRVDKLLQSVVKQLVDKAKEQQTSSP